MKLRTVEEMRQLLGAAGEALSDDEVRGLRDDMYAAARGVVALARAEAMPRAAAPQGPSRSRAYRRRVRKVA